ncbi:MAG: hypothetical protein MJ244_02575 [Clostridia bacterium]|nr:hypothetical protein [Clostridia bacterium]
MVKKLKNGKFIVNGVKYDDIDQAISGTKQKLESLFDKYSKDIKESMKTDKKRALELIKKRNAEQEQFKLDYETLLIMKDKEG